MTEAAVRKMAASARDDMTIYLNHDYKVPEDTFGSVESAEVTRRGSDRDGSPIWDLDLGIRIDESNPRAVQTWNSINGGTKLGTSIGAKIPKGGATKRADGSYLIDDVLLLEASIVSIPANPRSWVQYAIKALNSDGLVIEDDDEPDLQLSHGELPDKAFACISPGGTKGADGKTHPLSLRHYPHHTESGAVDEGLLKSALSRIANSGNEQCGKAHLRAHAKAEGIGSEKDYEDFDLIEALTDEFTEEHFITQAATCPKCGGSKGSPKDGCKSDFHSQPDQQNSVEPELTDATRVTVTVTSDDKAPSQEAPKSAPENDGGLADETADGDTTALGDDKTKAVTPDVYASMTEIFALLRSTTSELVETRKALALAEGAKVAAETERDAVKSAALSVVEETKRIIDQIAQTPLGRKTVFVEATREFDQRFGGVYSEDFLKILKG